MLTLKLVDRTCRPSSTANSCELSESSLIGSIAQQRSHKFALRPSGSHVATAEVSETKIKLLCSCRLDLLLQVFSILAAASVWHALASYLCFNASLDCSPELTLLCDCCCRSLQADVSNGKLPGDLVASAFRQMCQTAILHWWVPNRQQALYTNSLLNYGNEQLSVFDTSGPGRPESTASGSHQADAFWTVPPNFTGMFALNYPKAALPGEFQPGVLPTSSRRRSEVHKRQQPQSSLAAQQLHKRPKAGSNRSKGQAAGGRRHLQAPELSNKVQQRLATFLELVGAGAPPAEPTTVKQASPDQNWLGGI